MKHAAKHQAIILLAQGHPVSKVAAETGVTPRTIQRWLHGPNFGEALRTEVARAMFGSRRALGHLARQSISTASKAMQQLEHTLDDAAAGTAARDRAAHRPLQHAQKWGSIVDPQLDSREAAGCLSDRQRNEFRNEIKRLENQIARHDAECDKLLKCIEKLEELLDANGLDLPADMRAQLKEYETEETTDEQTNEK
jgi:hypothetical protein